MDFKPGDTGWSIGFISTKRNLNPAPANWLAQHAARTTSRWGEEGMLDELFRWIGHDNGWCCEFGAGDGELECNTFSLVNRDSWRAVYIEPDEEKFSKLQRRYADNERIICLNKAVSTSGSNSLDAILSGTECPKNLDLMIIDIDGNDLSVWESIELFAPRVLVIEFNSTIQGEVEFRQGDDFSKSQGSSLDAMMEVGRRKGYSLVATTTWNAFFVLDELAAKLPTTERTAAALHHGPTQFRLFQLYDGTLVLGGWSMLHWTPIRLSLEDIQVLPKALRRYRPELAEAHALLTAEGGFQTDPACWRSLFRPVEGNVLARKIRDDVLADAPSLMRDLLDGLGLTAGCVLSITHPEASHPPAIEMLVEEPDWRVLTVTTPEAARPCAAGFVPVPIETALRSDLEAWTAAIRTGIADLCGATGPEVVWIDLAGPDLHVAADLFQCRPRVVAVRFNPTIPNDIHFVQAERLDVNQGCSLAAVAHVARRSGYALAACAADTAFLVQEGDLPSIGVPDCGLEVDRMYRSAVLMKLFQLYDGSLRLAGERRLLWHGLTIGEDEIQVLPRALRRWYQTLPEDSAHRKLFYVD